MFDVYDYLDSTLENKPYDTIEAHLEDCLMMFDFLLDKSVVIRFDGTKNVFFPGSIMTDDTAQFFYDTAPLDRLNSIYDDEFATDFRQALNHIRSREKATKKIELPLVQIRKEFNLSLLEELSLLLSIGFSFNINRRNLYAYLANDATLTTPTVGVLYNLYQLIDRDADISMLYNLVNGTGKMCVFFLTPPDGALSKKSLMEIPIILRDDVFAFIVSKQGYNHNIPYTSLYEYEKTGLNIFSTVSSYKIENAGFVYISSKDSDDVLQFLKEKEDENIFVLDSEQLISDIKSFRSNHAKDLLTHALSMLLFRMRISSDILCIKMPYPLNDYSGLVLEIINHYLPEKTIYIYGADKFPIELISSRYFISSITLSSADFEERELIWNYFLNKEDMKLHEDINVSDLADCYEISFSKIRYAVTTTAQKAKWKGEHILDSFELKEELRRMGEAGFMSLAVYIPPVYSIDDLEIEETQKKILMIACNRFKIKNRVEKKHGIKRSGAYGNGVSILLCGPPGTGKTMAAQVVSKELSLPLYRVDLSQIISKYIGETQKNINDIFDQARKTNVVLFFDEADALFSKRTEVKDSNDKYANADTAYLLQKIEGHSGITILATNLFSNFDAAFVRRLSYVIHLEKPDEETRLKLWQSILPDTVELSKDIDFKFFASNFELSGSEIKGILYSAMYMAEAEGKPLGNGEIARSIQLRPEKHNSINMAVELGKYSGFMLS